MIKDRELHEAFQTTAAKVVQDERGERDVRVSIDASYATGNPKTVDPGDTAVGSDTVPIVMSYGPVFPRASESAVQGYVNDQPVLRGKIVTLVGNPTSGQYKMLPVYPSSSTAFTTPTGTADQVRCFRFELEFEIKLKWIVHEVVTAAGGSHGSFSIWTSDGNNKLADTGAEDWSGNGVKSGLVTEVLLNPQCYILAWTTDSATVTLRSVGSPANFGVQNDQVVIKGQAANSSSAAVMPGSLGALTGATFDIPLVKLQSA